MCLLFLLVNSGILVDTKHQDNNYRHIQVIQFLLSYFVSCAFMTGSYFPHLVFRLVILALFNFTFPRHREAMGDLEDSTLLSSLGAILILIQEISVYSYYRNYAELFIETHTHKTKQ